MKPHSHAIPVPNFEQPPLKDLSDVEERSDSNDIDFEIHEDSVRRGFDQQELKYLTCVLGLLVLALQCSPVRIFELNNETL